MKRSRTFEARPALILVIVAGGIAGSLAASQFTPPSAHACSCEADETAVFALELVSVESSDGSDQHQQHWPASAFIAYRDPGIGEAGFYAEAEVVPGVVQWLKLENW